MSETSATYEAEQAVRVKLNEFDAAIAANENLEIDGIDGNTDKIKVINHDSKSAFEVELKTIMLTPVRDLVKALDEGVFEGRVYGVSRIVGFGIAV